MSGVRCFSDGSRIVPLTPELAAKCGYSMESDPWGNTKVYMSLLNCYAENQVKSSNYQPNFHILQPGSPVLQTKLAVARSTWRRCSVWPVKSVQ